jgi:hypothetical protein
MIRINTEKGKVTLNENISNLKNGNYFLLLNNGEKVSRQTISVNNK